MSEDSFSKSSILLGGECLSLDATLAIADLTDSSPRSKVLTITACFGSSVKGWSLAGLVLN